MHKYHIETRVEPPPPLPPTYVGTTFEYKSQDLCSVEFRKQRVSSKIIVLGIEAKFIQSYLSFKPRDIILSVHINFLLHTVMLSAFFLHQGVLWTQTV